MHRTPQAAAAVVRTATRHRTFSPPQITITDICLLRFEVIGCCLGLLLESLWRLVSVIRLGLEFSLFRVSDRVKYQLSWLSPGAVMLCGWENNG